jgi:hypothetical protein
MIVLPSCPQNPSLKNVVWDLIKFTTDLPSHSHIHYVTGTMHP